MTKKLQLKPSRLREQLQNIIDNHATKDGLREQIRLIAMLAARYPHSIRLLDETFPTTPVFNCHEYTFGLRDSQELKHLHRRFPITVPRHPGREFVVWLVDNVLTEIRQSECIDGDIVVYFRNECVEHSGIWHDGTIRSKWGRTHVWEHAIQEAPADYGDQVRFFQRISPEQCDVALRQFAEEKIPRSDAKSVGVVNTANRPLST